MRMTLFKCMLLLIAMCSFGANGSFWPTFNVYSRSGKLIRNYDLEKMLNPENSIRWGVKINPNSRFGYDSKFGLGFVVEF